MNDLESTVRAFFEAWREPDHQHILSFFADDATFTDPSGTRTGKDDISSALEGQIAAVGSVDAELLNVASTGSTVMVERVERLSVGDVALVVEGAVVVEFDDQGLVKRFTDYHDQVAIANQLGAGGSTSHSRVMGVLDGLRVVEGSAFVAAPLGGMALAQLGADVIRFDAVMTPTDDDLERALTLLRLAEVAGGGVCVDDDGRMIDEAVLRGARRTVARRRPGR